MRNSLKEILTWFEHDMSMEFDAAVVDSVLTPAGPVYERLVAYIGFHGGLDDQNPQLSVQNYLLDAGYPQEEIDLFFQKLRQEAMKKESYRVIKIDRDALWEFIYESFIDREESFFDVPVTDITSHFDIDFSTGEFICLIHKTEDEKGQIIPPPEELDLEKLLHNMKATTKTLFAPGRYVDLTLEDLRAIQDRCHSAYSK